MGIEFNNIIILPFQNPDEDTEWNDILRAKGIIPKKKEKEITEEDVINLVEQTVREKQNGNINCLKCRVLIGFEDIAVVQ